MTIQGAIAELQNLLKVNDVPFYYKGGIQKVIETIQMDAQPKRGEWIVKQSGFAECSVCEQHYFSDYNFCPNCGARMTDSEKPNNCEQTEREGE